MSEATRLPSVAVLMNIIGGSCHKYHFCRGETSFVATKRLLSRQNYACRDKIIFVATNTCLSRRNVFYRDKIVLAATKLYLSRQTRVCHEKRFVATRILLSCILFIAYFCRVCRDKSKLVTTKRLSRQRYVSRNKYLA